MKNIAKITIFKGEKGGERWISVMVSFKPDSKVFIGVVPVYLTAVASTLKIFPWRFVIKQ